jgi:hypothetical protein
VTDKPKAERPAPPKEQSCITSTTGTSAFANVVATGGSSSAKVSSGSERPAEQPDTPPVEELKLLNDRVIARTLSLPEALRSAFNLAQPKHADGCSCMSCQFGLDASLAERPQSAAQTAGTDRLKEALHLIVVRVAEWETNGMGSVADQKKRWQLLGKIAERALSSAASSPEPAAHSSQIHTDLKIRCHGCRGLQIWRYHEEGDEIEVFHDCTTTHGQKFRTQGYAEGMEAAAKHLTSEAQRWRAQAIKESSMTHLWLLGKAELLDKVAAAIRAKASAPKGGHDAGTR